MGSKAYIEKLGVDELADYLLPYLDEDVITILKDQKVKGKDFLSLTEPTLKLFGFPLGHVLQIVQFKKNIDDEQIESESETVPSNTSANCLNTDHPTGSGISLSSNEESDSDAVVGEKVTDDDLLQYMTLNDLKALSSYEKISLKNRIRNHRLLAAKGLASSSRPLGFENYIKSKEKATGSRPLSEPNQQSLTGVKTWTRSSTRLKATRQQLVQPRPADDSSSESSNDENAGPDVSGDPKEMYKVPHLTRTREQLKAIRPNLSSFEVAEVLANHRQTKTQIAKWLEEGYVLISKHRKLVYRILMKHLCWTVYKHPNEVSSEAIEGLAKKYVCTYPQYQKPLEVNNKTPWSHIYRTGGKGHFANVLKRIQSSLPDEERKRKSKVKRRKVSTVATSNHNVDIKAMALLFPGRVEKDQIFDGMTRTFSVRQDQRRKGGSITSLLQEFPHFINYKGALISQEFLAMQPLAKDMCPRFHKHVESILEWWPTQTPLECSDSIIRACFNVACKLPHPIPSQAVPSLSDVDRNVSGSLLPHEKDLIVVLGPSTEIEDYVINRKNNSAGPVQPYLISIKSDITNELLKFFLVLDSRPVDLGHIDPIRAIDWVFKSCVVFNVFYPPSWINFFRFLQTCYYEIFFEDEDDAPASAVELFGKLQSNSCV